jgi:hypothetical protein
MLLVACAVGARTVLVGCGNNSGCMGFYTCDASPCSPNAASAFDGSSPFPDGSSVDAAPDVQPDEDATSDATTDATDEAVEQ